MRTDLTHAIRLRQLRADYERAGRDFDADKLGIPVTASGTADYTGSEVARLLRDEDGQQAARQHEVLDAQNGAR